VGPWGARELMKSYSGSKRFAFSWPLRLAVACCLALAFFVPRAALAGTATSQSAQDVTATDNFSRPNGGLGPNWTDNSSGGLTIVSDQVQGTNSGGDTGDMRTAETYPSDQYSQIQVTSTQLTGTQWIAAAARMQSGGMTGYAGLYWWNNSSPVLMLFKRVNGNWAQIGSTYNSGPLAAGTTLQVVAQGSTISFLENGITRITTTDTSITGGAPGIMINGLANAGSWAGGSVSSTASYTVGGTVAGLSSGTVVLQDNGGDNLSLSANGSFTFATALASGATYNVTVASAPSGEACTVTGGSGTISAANITGVAVICTTGVPGSGETDNFNRANGSLGPNWTNMSDGGLTIASQQVQGTNSGGDSGDIRTAEAYSSDQYSQIQVTSTQLTGTQWIGATVRSQNSGLTGYIGIYYWNNGSPVLMLFKRVSGNWGLIGSTYNSGPLAAGTQLRLSVIGSSVSFLENGIQRISATDTSITGGAPGIMINGLANGGAWAGGNATATTTYTVGGTVSGLSGTVLLEDNGGDNLSVSANGPFTFPTALPNGTAYSVTVGSYPSGQTCAVTGGSGTVSGGAVTGVSVTCQNAVPVSSATDNFNRADGSLGPNWTDATGGGVAISSQEVIGGNPNEQTGDTRTAEVYTGDQYSQIQVTSTQLTGTEWIGASVRTQDAGLTAYVGIYYWNNGSPTLMLFRRVSGNWAEIGGTYNCGPLAAGTQLKVEVVGSTIAFLENGVERVTAGDTTISGGAPGIMINGAGTLDNWAGGSAGFSADYLSTDSTGIASYDVISADNSDGAQVMRVLQPTNPAPGVAHNFLFVLPVEAGQGSTYGDALKILQAMDAQDKYNLTIIEPTFGIDPWYADNPVNGAVQYESFMTQELVPWVDQNLATSGSEQNWLIGFSKSGYGAQDLILKHPNLFSLAASWDFPADMSTYTQYGDSEGGYGTDANFQANYRLTQSFVDANKGPFLNANRIWIGSYGLYQTDMADYDALLTAEGIQHTTETPTSMAHRWDSGWVPLAMAALYQDSLNLPK